MVQEFDFRDEDFTGFLQESLDSAYSMNLMKMTKQPWASQKIHN